VLLNAFRQRLVRNLEKFKELCDPSGVDVVIAGYHGSVDPRLFMLNPAGSGMRDARISEKVSAGEIRSPENRKETCDDRPRSSQGEFCDPSGVDVVIAGYHGSVDPRLFMLNPAGSRMRDAGIPEKVSAGVTRCSKMKAERATIVSDRREANCATRHGLIRYRHLITSRWTRGY
jgi:20S proteasome alpha/beta subunit